MNNFRQYKGIHEIKLDSSDKNKNVTVILGTNTSGKTTLLQAFNWVLYGEANFKTKDFLLNLELIDENSNIHNQYEVSVKLELSHDDIDYIIERKQLYSFNRNNRVQPGNANLEISYINENGQTKFINDLDYQEDTIRKIMPKELMSYFFFDGERIENLGRNEKNGKEDLANAVKTVLGLDAIEKTIKHLGGGNKNSVIGQYRESLDEEGNHELREAKDRLETKTKEFEEKVKIKKELHNSEEYYENRKTKLEEILKEDQDAKHLQLERKQNEASIKQLTKENKSSFDSIKKQFNEKAPYFIGKSLINRAGKTLKEDESFDKGIPHMHGDSINFLIERGYCLCGTPLNNRDEAYDHIKKEQEFLPPQSLGTIIQTYQKNATYFISSSDGLYEDIENDYRTIRKNLRDISKYEERNVTISNEITTEKDIGKIEEELTQVNQKIKEITYEVAATSNEIENIEKQIEDIKKKIDELSTTSERNNNIVRYIKYANEMYFLLNEKYKGEEDNIKSQLEKNVNDIFQEMYHGERSISINDKYVYRLNTPDIHKEYSTKADESKGLEVVTSFSFICGIVKLAREHLGVFQDQISSESYPLVMDGPFSNADEKHVENIAQLMPSIANQVVIFVMHKDWNYAEEVLGDRIANRYELNKESETNTIIKEG